MDLKHFQYIILEKDRVLEHPDSADLYNHVYTYWRKTWRAILMQSGGLKTWSGDDFFRQTYIPVVMYKNEIVATHCSTIFHMNNSCLRDLKYFSIFNNKVNSWIEKHNVQKLMSMEFLSVRKGWREAEMGFSFAEVLIGLGSKIVAEQKICAAIGVSVKAAKITEKSSKLNYELVTDDVERGKIPCDVICLDAKKSQPHQDVKTNEVINYLWKNREKLNMRVANKRVA